MTLPQVLCRIFIGHETIKQTENGKLFLVCIRCLHRSAGVTCPKSIAFWTTTDLQQALDEVMETELRLQCGG